MLAAAKDSMSAAAARGRERQLELFAAERGEGGVHGGPFCALDRLAIAEELVVLVVAAVPATDVGEVCDELDALDPLDLLESELGLVAQPQRCAVAERQRLVV